MSKSLGTPGLLPASATHSESQHELWKRGGVVFNHCSHFPDHQRRAFQYRSAVSSIKSVSSERGTIAVRRPAEEGLTISERTDQNLPILFELMVAGEDHCPTCTPGLRHSGVYWFNTDRCRDTARTFLCVPFSGFLENDIKTTLSALATLSFLTASFYVLMSFLWCHFDFSRWLLN